MSELIIVGVGQREGPVGGVSGRRWCYLGSDWSKPVSWAGSSGSWRRSLSPTSNLSLILPLKTLAIPIKKLEITTFGDRGITQQIHNYLFNCIRGQHNSSDIHQPTRQVGKGGGVTVLYGTINAPHFSVQSAGKTGLFLQK